MKIYGLFIGIDRYSPGCGFPELTYAASDANKIQSSLLRASPALSADDAIVLTDSSPEIRVTRNVMEAKLDEICDGPSEQDLLMFYFAGHGFDKNIDGEGSYLAPSDVQQNKSGKFLPRTAFSVNEILDRLRESAAKQILIILDACRRDMDRVRRGPLDRLSLDFGSDVRSRSDLRMKSDGRVWQVMFSCLPEASAIENSKLEGGAWTYCLCEAITHHSKQLQSSSPKQTASAKAVFETAKSKLIDLMGSDEQVPRLYSEPEEGQITLITKPPTEYAENPWKNLRKEIHRANKRVRKRIGNFETVTNTPLKRSRRLEDRFGCSRLYFKLECLQNTGSFKFRGASNAIEKLYEHGEHPVIVTASAGNHGLGLAVAAVHRGLQCHVFMPEHTPLTKSAAVRLYTNNVHLVGQDFDECEERARAYSEKLEDAVFIHPFEHPAVVAGQGTIGLELLDDWDKLRKENAELGNPDYVIIPCGGGGLLAGIGTILHEEWRKTQIIAVEPAEIPSLYKAMTASTQIPRVNGDTIADGIAVGLVGRNTLACIKNFLTADDVWRVQEEAISVAMLNLMEDARVTAEGAGATSLAGMIQKDLETKLFFQDKTVICIVSGGNLDIASLSSIVSRGLVAMRRRARYGFIVPDRPGELAALTGVLADLDINILDLQHARYSDQIEMNCAQVNITVETQGAEHENEIFEKLRYQGRVKVFRLGLGGPQ